MNRFFATLIITAIAFSSVAAEAKGNPKYAGIVIDADTGQVLYESHADARRYPASLTKMMTLYMTFDALERGKLKLDDKLRVSEKAASQPQTNIGLSPGEKISVDELIRSLVVRSANDSAVVLAEGIGKSEWNFAVRMTSKASELGLEHTVFRNPHGLPDSKQVTTARDMAKLGLALKRDFPQYYDYFKTTSFSHKGRTYTTHNHVMKDYDGVDGIKTGYIRASGFNLVTSAHKDGYNLVAVVMGGVTSKRRDNHMKSLLDRSFTQLAKLGRPARSFASSVPLPAEKPTSTNSVFAEAGFDAPATGELASLVPVSKPSPTDDDTVTNILRVSFTGEKIVERGQEWGIQVGAFTDEQKALMAAANAVDMAREHLGQSRITVTDTEGGKQSTHRARLANLSEKQARKACKLLISNKSPCFVFNAVEERNL